MTLALSGHIIESGIALGQTHVIRHNELEIGEFRIAAEDVEGEIKRLERALLAAREHLETLADRLRSTSGAPAEEIIRMHIHMLEDSSIIDGTAAHIRQQRCNAEWGLQLQLEALSEEFRAIDDDYIRSREEDLVHVVTMVQQNLVREGPGSNLDDIPDRLGNTLVIANELTPGELAVLHERGVAGVVTEHGSPYSHTAILARSLGIPMVMGVRRAQSLIKEGERLILDGHYGVVFADPEESILNHYIAKQAKSRVFLEALESVRDQPAISRDQIKISLLANAEREKDISRALRAGASGVGLFRSEFLYLKGEAPDEDTQFAHYSKALAALEGGSLTIRTLDIGADKQVEMLDFGSLRSNPNPALGLRAIRLCLREMELFKTQLRAILRTSALGPVRCLIPMLTSTQEVQAVHSLLEETRLELRQAGMKFDEKMPIGGMIEVPAAALAMKEVCASLDFVSVGTNDLIQYALAADRVDENVAHLYDPQHPGVLYLLTHVFESAKELGLPLAVCGELAGDRRYTRLLLAMGLREFSMQPRNLLEIKKVIGDTNINRAREAYLAWREAGGIEGFSSLVHYLDHTQAG